jgi:hypothetical protein
MGSVAKTQARGQQSSPQVTPFSEQKDGQEELRIQRVNETKEAEKNRLTKQDEEKDKRKRRRLKRTRKKGYHSKEESGRGHQDPDTGNAEQSNRENEGEVLGSLIDLRV